MKIFFAVLIVFCTLTANAQKSSSRPWLLSSSAAGREAKRFTLAEWLDNKDRRTMMDLWLSMNTPSPYEFVISGAVQNYDLETTSGTGTTKIAKSDYVGYIDAYARFIGLTLEHQNNYVEGFNDTTGIFNLRLFGNTVQGTHLTLHYGLRTRTATNGSYRLNQGFPGATLQLYIMKYFGIQGNYRSFSPVTESYFGETTATEVTYGAFIEFGSLRIFGDVYQETQSSKLNNVQTDTKRNGGRAGIKLYF